MRERYELLQVSERAKRDLTDHLFRIFGYNGITDPIEKHEAEQIMLLTLAALLLDATAIFGDLDRSVDGGAKRAIDALMKAPENHIHLAAMRAAARSLRVPANEGERN